MSLVFAEFLSREQNSSEEDGGSLSQPEAWTTCHVVTARVWLPSVLQRKWGKEGQKSWPIRLLQLISLVLIGQNRYRWRDRSRNYLIAHNCIAFCCIILFLLYCTAFLCTLLHWTILHSHCSILQLLNCSGRLHSIRL